MSTHNYECSDEYIEEEFRVLVRINGAVVSEEWFSTCAEASDYARDELKRRNTSASAHVERVKHTYTELSMFSHRIAGCRLHANPAHLTAAGLCEAYELGLQQGQDEDYHGY